MRQRTHILLSFCLLASCIVAQNKTISTKSNERETYAAHKALLVPFEPKLYMSEIDRNIHAETKLSPKEIKHKFRDGLNEQIYKAFKAAKYNVVDLMEDTVRYKKDVEGVYQYLSYEYLKVPDQNNFKAPEKEKQGKKVEKGQLIVETDGEKRFMNSRITNPKFASTLHNKYKADVFVLINQLDIHASGYKEPGDPGEGNPNRKITVHYSVYTADGKVINSGIAEEEFDPALNNPKKIIEKHFSKIATMIVQRVNKGLGIVQK